MAKEQVLELLHAAMESVDALPVSFIGVSIYNGVARVQCNGKDQKCEDMFMDYTKDMPRTYRTYYDHGVDTGDEFVTATDANGVELFILRSRP